ncbi:MAG TPA: ATP-dependent RecD-like DNA helicase [Candidatus Babeliales bacterium]|jgi:exodeoxyribonuclease V alpha subunit|nr:ATP-dependent RecD-like DNA helicase [Candidatus Babeliales bacterium]
MLEIESLQGIVDRVIYQNQENGFAVFIVQLNAKNAVTVKGYVPIINAGEQVLIRGVWNMHQKFGKQFDAQSCEKQAPTSILGLKKYLGSGLIKGIGPVYGDKLVAAFGEKVLEVIDKNPERLMSVPGIGAKRVEKIITAWKDQKEISNIMVFLQNKGISATYAVKIYKQYKEKAIAIIEENPYRLAQDIWGIGFKTADQIAQKSGIAPDCKRRIVAAILHVIQTTSGNGNLYIQLEELKKEMAELLELESDTIQHTTKCALHDLYNADKIKLLTHNDIHYITLPSFYFSEKGIVHKLDKLITYPSHHTFDFAHIQKTLQDPTHSLVLNDQQQLGVLACLQNKVTIITGGPGTGKTTLIKKLLMQLDMQRVKYSLAAPTGRAAKRITEGTGRPAYTLHRLLDFDVSTMSFKHNESHPLAVDFLIVDEASMIDIFLAGALIKALPTSAHLVLIGDIDQLPSVGAGNFLHDMIASKKFVTISLKHIFRQAQNSLIVINAHRINNGEFPESAHENARKDFIFIKEDNPENIPQHLELIYAKVLSHYGIHKDDAIVLTPMHRGVAGTQKLNHDLQQMLNNNNGGFSVTYAGTQFQIGDRVMQLRNNYDKNVFNGDIGIIENINAEDKTVHVRFLETFVDYELSDLNELVHAYAISIHKSQGSEFSAVIIPIFMQHFMMLQRNLLYTAVTRAKKLCIIIGQSRAVAMGIKNNKSSERITFLQQFLTTDLACR